jgi:hypothetical protein
MSSTIYGYSSLPEEKTHNQTEFEYLVYLRSYFQDNGIKIGTRTNSNYFHFSWFDHSETSIEDVRQRLKSYKFFEINGEVILPNDFWNMVNSQTKQQ